MKILNSVKSRLIKYKPTLVGSLVLVLFSFVYHFRNMLYAYLSVKLVGTFTEGSFANILLWGYLQCARMFGDRGFAVITVIHIASVVYIFYSLRFLPKSSKPFSPVTKAVIDGAGLLVSGWNFLWGGSILDKPDNTFLVFTQLFGAILLVLLYLGLVLIVLSDLLVFVLTLLF